MNEVKLLNNPFELVRSNRLGLKWVKLKSHPRRNSHANNIRSFIIFISLTFLLL